MVIKTTTNFFFINDDENNNKLRLGDRCLALCLLVRGAAGRDPGGSRPPPLCRLGGRIKLTHIKPSKTLKKETWNPPTLLKHLRKGTATAKRPDISLRISTLTFRKVKSSANIIMLPLSRGVIRCFCGVSKASRKYEYSVTKLGVAGLTSSRRRYVTSINRK